MLSWVAAWQREIGFQQVHNVQNLQICAEIGEPQVLQKSKNLRSYLVVQSQIE